ncbi:uncharacterized protein MONBRDRAFT_36594 [Monosiga brevicollis MX1]|uniref:Uncharacterized protein n=1 Tax=Monosiga brevicollis TaxID=81824 RepID=A9UWB7_MONBE|nr:uncharacterized protein MONBRDRAFT_36594 [Monosiga brevicollis MX1]EDQ90739.1 predicted protein [Monosiga brevicollis MX1]|eukprot:XP_001744790.1 hypothetical protein [Monosiga brevicollis MX1]
MAKMAAGTLRTADFTVRGGRVERAQPVDMRYTRTYRNDRDPDAAQLRETALGTTSGARRNARTAPTVVPRAAIRRAVDGTIHDTQRDQRVLVLSLREVQARLTAVHNGLHRHTQRLQTELEVGPRRLAGLASASLVKRRQRAVPASNDDVTSALKQERTEALEAVQRFERQLQQNRALLQQLSRDEKALRRHIDQEKSSLTLHDEHHSGVVQQHSRPQGQPPASVVQATTTSLSAKAAQSATETLLSEIGPAMRALYERTNSALRNSIANASRLKSENALARGQCIVSRNAAARAAERVDLTHQLNHGPRETRFRTVSERVDRPMVRSLGRNEHIDRSAVVGWESSERGNVTLAAKTRSLTRDTARLESERTQRWYTTAGQTAIKGSCRFTVVGQQGGDTTYNVVSGRRLEIGAGSRTGDLVVVGNLLLASCRSATGGAFRRRCGRTRVCSSG